MKSLLGLLVLVLVLQHPVVTGSPFCLLAQHQAGVMAQQPWTPAPGNPGHGVPPDGWYCSTSDPEPEKRCACQRIDTSKDCEGDPTEDNVHCKVACHRARCHCAVTCMPGFGQPETGEA